MDEEINQSEADVEADKPSRPDNRFTELSNKVKTTAEERDKATKEKAEAEAKATEAQKEVEFYKGFNTVSSKYQGATEYQDKIREKVMAGYDMEDATISILAREGKFTAPAPMPRQSPAGGSAPTTMRSGGEKELAEMTRDEKREALMEIERESGGVSNMLRRGI